MAQTKASFYHPFLYKLLIKSLQYSIQGTFETLKSTPTTTILQKWATSRDNKILEGNVHVSRNTLKKLLDFPDSKSIHIQKQILNEIAGAILTQWIVKKEGNYDLISENLTEILEDRLKNGTSSSLFKAYNKTFEDFISYMEILSNVPSHFYDLNKLINEDDCIKMTQRDKSHIKKLVRDTIKYNYTDNEEKYELELKASIDQNFYTSSISDYFTKKEKINIQTLRVGLPPYQDTILPYYFESDFNINLNINFIFYENWDDFIESFRNNEIDLCIHNFPAMLAANILLDQTEYLPNFFYPLFSFSGYGVFIRKKRIYEILNLLPTEYKSFSELSSEQISKVLNNVEIIIECGSDFEWAIRKFVTYYSIDKYNLIDEDVNDGRRLFMSDKKGDLYCCNPPNMLKVLEKEDEFELVWQGKDFDHENFNGIISNSEFVDNNLDTIAEFIHIWFKSITYFNKIVASYTGNRLIIGSKAIQTGKGKEANFLAKSITEFINTQTGNQNKTMDLIPTYDIYNSFFENPKDSFNSFYSDNHLFNKKIKAVYKEIALLSSDGNDISNEKLEQIIKSIVIESKKYS